MSERSANTRALDALVAEAKPRLGRHLEDGARAYAVSTKVDEIDWAKLEARVMAVIESDVPAVRPVAAGRVRRYALLAGAAALAAAAALALVARTSPPPSPNLPIALAPAPTASAASSLSASEGSGEIRVDGVVVAPGHALHAGASIETDGARAVFERPGKVTWLIEQDGAAGEARARGVSAVARARVKSAGEPLVLDLEHGVIEADVVPVSAGEAFAVDVATTQGLVRVAVHGTHLRVARSGDRVVIDLTEGVISIGAPPPTGMTHGTRVTAPAHVELDATDLGSIRIDHAASSVRAAAPIGRAASASTAGRMEAAPRPAPLTPVVQASQPATTKLSSSAEAPAQAAEPKPPREAIAAAIRDCAASHARSGAVRVTLSSKLHLRVSPSGSVVSAQFVPPLSPDVQTCAAQAIYKTKLDEVGLVTIPIELSY